ncbi:hypothetical protein Ga0076813_10753 [endosymbiont of Ridgeia piscesae]|uniref:Uncharacterized protein n=1 Tax=endosymbiont of Ridgeia piscesae TaxID=54398 RepID=A0A0T5Z344_9GAMM|nr:hypothetical protein Ga0076813_10753 [endosymbiont of Ridgeia piscesae]
MIELHLELSINQQCQLLNISRSTHNYCPCHRIVMAYG